MYINAEGYQTKSNNINRIERKDKISFRSEIKYRIRSEDEDNRKIVYISEKGYLIPMTPTYRSTS